MVTTKFTPMNDLEKRLLAAHDGDIEVDTLMSELMESTVFMPVYEKHQIGGLQPSTDDKATPLTLQEESGTTVLILFSSPEMGKGFLKNFPGYGGGLLTELKWIVEKVGTDYAFSINPDNEVGIDLEAGDVKRLYEAVEKTDS